MIENLGLVGWVSRRREDGKTGRLTANLARWVLCRPFGVIQTSSL